MDINVSLKIGFFKTIWNLVVQNYHRIYNYIFRPKLDFNLKLSIIKFSDNSEKYYNLTYPVLEVYSKKSIHIDPRNIFVGPESYRAILGGDNAFSYFSNENGKLNFATCSNDVFNLFKNWGAVDRGEIFIEINKSSPKIFPIPFAESILVKNIKQPYIFFSNKNIIIKLKINNKIWHYGINKENCNKVYFNFLSHHWCPMEIT